MKELITLLILTALVFFLFVLSIIVGLKRKNKRIKFLSVSLFLVFISLSFWTAFNFSRKAYNIVSDNLKPRTGDEIYDALFDKRKTNCVKIINHQDQVVPKIDYAIWLNFETCPKELERILDRHKFSMVKLSTSKWNEKIPYGETIKWFNPTTLGDSIIVYEYSSEDGRNVQTIWSSLDSTKIFVRDIVD